MRNMRWVAILAALMIVLAACGGDDTAADDGDDGTDGDTTTTTQATTTTEAMSDDGDTGDDGDMMDTDPVTGLPVIDPFEVPEGDVAMAGSSTVFPLTQQVQILWEDEGGPRYSLDSIGSSGGFERFCKDGDSDISNASRAIRDSEVEDCRAIGREPIEIRVGTDALTVVISTGNYFAQEMSFEEIATAFSLADTGATWADVNAGFPAHPIAMYSPGEDSGTFDYFNEEVFPEEDEADLPSPILSSIANIVGENDDVTVTGVSQDGCTEGDLASTCAIGYFGYAYYINNASVLQAVAVEGISPSDDTVNDNSYPLARPLFIYTAPSVIAEKPQVAQFIAFYLNRVNDVIGIAGYFPAPEETIKAAADVVKDAAGF